MSEQRESYQFCVTQIITASALDSPQPNCFSFQFLYLFQHAHLDSLSIIMSSHDSSTPVTFVAATTSIATIIFLSLARTILWPSQPKTIRNPLATGVYAKSNAQETKNLVYQPDTFPGARDVETPVGNPSRTRQHQQAQHTDLENSHQYGAIRVYEFGPETGQKVLLVHGISTPCITLGPIANALAKRGYRVMLFVSPWPNHLVHLLPLIGNRTSLAVASRTLSQISLTMPASTPPRFS